jgi:hypothetical protein
MRSKESGMSYDISQESVAALVAYPFPAGVADTDSRIVMSMRRGPGWLVAGAAATANLAAFRQWSVDALGDEGMSERMREVNRDAINRWCDWVVDGEFGTAPPLPPGLPPGSHWVDTGGGWYLELGGVPSGPAPGNGDEPITPPDIVACGVQFLRAGQARLGTVLTEELTFGGRRLIDVGISQLAG